MMSKPRVQKTRGVINMGGTRLPRKEAKRRFISPELRKISKDKIRRKTTAPKKIFASGQRLKPKRKRREERSRMREKA